MRVPALVYISSLALVSAVTAAQEACQKPFSANADVRCSVNADCAVGMICSPMKVCLPPAEDGARCNESGGCSSGYCSQTGICHTPSSKLRAYGMSCSRKQNCASGYCNDSICATRLPAGSVCSSRSPEACVSGICVRSRCSTIPLGATLHGKDETAKENESCTRTSHCGGDLYCKRGLCAKRKEAGGECKKGRTCLSGNCLFSGVCSADKNVATSEACRHDHQCQTGRCSDRVCVA